MRRQAFILFPLAIFSWVAALGAQKNGTDNLSHPTVEELHRKLNERVAQFKADEDQRRKNTEKANPGDKKGKEEKDKGSDDYCAPDEFCIILEQGGLRTALDRDNPVILEKIVMKMAGNKIAAIELKYQEAALRRQFSHQRSIKNDDIAKTTYGHLNLYYHAEGDTEKSEILLNMSSTDRAKLLAIYIDGLLRSIRDLDDRVLAAKKYAGKKMNSALNMGVRIK